MRDELSKGKLPVGLFFVGSMFIGMGLGFLFGNFMAGMFIGMGVGFINMAVVKMNNQRSENPLEE